MAAVIFLLVLFPLLYLFDTRLAMGALLLAIIALYHTRTAKTRPKKQGGLERPQTPWKDPWGPPVPAPGSSATPTDGPPAGDLSK